MDKAPDAFRTISEVADELDLPQHVLRFWESRFPQIKPLKRGGGRRYYRPEDIDLLRGIRHLLYGDGYTIRGVQRLLKDHGPKFVQAVWRAGAAQPEKSPANEEPDAPSPAGTGEETARRLFGILPRPHGGKPAPSLSARAPLTEPREGAEAAADAEAEDDDVRPPAAAPAPAVRPAGTNRPAPASVQATAPMPVASAGELRREHVHKLRATLLELTECRRLIEAVLNER